MYIYRACILNLENRSCGAAQQSPSITLQPGTRFRRQLQFVASVLAVAVTLASGCSGYVPKNSATGDRNDSAFASPIRLTATPPSANFGAVAVGTQNTQTIQLHNAGSQSVVIHNAAVAGSAFSVSDLSAPLTLASGATKSFTLGFLPSAVGSVTGSVTLESANGTTLAFISVNGTGEKTSRSLDASTSVLNFGNETVGGSSTLGVNLVNAGNSSVTVSQTSASGSGFSVLGGVSGATIAAGQSTTLQIVFTPKAAGSAAGTITVTSNATNSPVSLKVSGTGVTGSTSSQGSSTAHTVALSWSPSTSSNITGYNVYRSTNAGGSYARINSSPTNTTKYADGNVAAGETYYYVVTALSSNGEESAYSNQISAAVP